MEKLAPELKASVFYHSFFEYPLKREELIKWCLGKEFLFLFPKKIKVFRKQGFYFLEKKEYTILLRKKREVFSRIKISIAQKAASVLFYLPTIKLVALTGSVAMKNADSDSDVDLMIIVKSGFLWTTRFLVYFLLFIFGLTYRRFGDKKTKDKLCLNIWLDENHLAWPKKDVFVAHEVLQIIPLLNRNATYERFLAANSWALPFWPKAVNRNILKRDFKNSSNSCFFYLWLPFEVLFFLLQRFYMLGKIKNETVGLNRAVFHPIDL